MKVSNSRILYIHDTLCGWCYIALPEVEKLHDLAEGMLPFGTIHRHLFTAAQGLVIDDVFYKYIEHAGTVTGPKMTGQRFSQAYLDLVRHEAFRHVSDLTALAVAAVKHLAADKTHAYAAALQRQVFAFGQFPDREETMLAAAESAGIDPRRLRPLLHDEAIRDLATQEALGAQQILQAVGATGVPALLLQHEDGLHKLDPYNAAASFEYVRRTIAAVRA